MTQAAADRDAPSRPSPVAVVLATTATRPGGVVRHLRDLGEGLKRDGHRVVIGGPDGSAALQALAWELGTYFRPLSVAPSAGEVFHLHLPDTFDRSTVPVLRRARRAGAKVVLTEHLPRTNASDGSLTDDRRTPGSSAGKTMFKRYQYRLADRVIAVSASSQQFLRTRYGLAPDRVVVVENGIPLGDATPGLPFAERDGVVCVGSVILQKGHDVLIRAAARSRRPWAVTVLGEGAQRAQWEALALRLAPGRVRFVGWVDDPSGLVAAARVCVLPSRWESFPYVVGEARAVGTPVAGTRVDGVSDQIEDGVSGCLVDPGDDEGLAAAVDRLVEDEEHWSRLRAGGLEHARRYPVERMVRATEHLYQDVLYARTPNGV